MFKKVAGVVVRVVSRVIIVFVPTDEFLPGDQKTHVSIISFKQQVKRRLLKKGKVIPVPTHKKITKPSATNLRVLVVYSTLVLLLFVCTWLRR